MCTTSEVIHLFSLWSCGFWTRPICVSGMEEEGTFGNQSGQREKHDEPTIQRMAPHKIADHALMRDGDGSNKYGLVGLENKGPLLSNGVFQC